MLVATVAEAADRFGERPAYIEAADEDGSGPHLTYRELDRRSDAVAAGMARRGLGEGDVVALLLPPGIDHVVCYVAAAKLGAVTAPIDIHLPTAQRHELLSLVHPRLLVGEGGEGPHDLIGPQDAAPPRLPDDPDRDVAVVFTSGTTGTPRGAVFRGAQLAAITAMEVGRSWGGGGRSLATTSFAHLGFMTKLPAVLRRGGTVHVLASWDSARVADLTARLGLTTVAGVPTQIALLVRRPELAGADLGSVETVVVGGAPSTPALVRRAREVFGAPVCVRYACTEAGTGTGTRPEDAPEDAEFTVGRPRPDVDVTVRDDAGAVLAPGEVGEVHLRSGAAMDRYWDDPTATAAVIRPDGAIRTGDLGTIDEQGRLRLVGRTKEAYVRGGYNVFPQVVERVLADHPAIAEVAVVPVPDEVMGEIGVAVVVPAGTVPALQDLHGFAGDRLARHELPERLVVVDRLPLTAGDKVDRRALAAAVRLPAPDAGVRLR